MPSELEIQLNAAVDAIVASNAEKKIVVAGPGTGKTWLFKRLLEADGGEADNYLVLTFINNLKNDLERGAAWCQVFVLCYWAERGIRKNYPKLLVARSTNRMQVDP